MTVRSPAFYGEGNGGHLTGRTSNRPLAVTEGNRPPSPLNQLDEKLRAARAKREATERGKPNEGLGIGFRISVELAAAIGVGTAIGILLDRWLGTSPWLLIVFFLIGCFAAFLNVYRTSQEFDKQRQARRQADENKDA